MCDSTITGISGPIIRAKGLGEAGLFEMVEVGEQRIAGEIVRLEGAEAHIQLYDDGSGLAIGAPVAATGRPLSVLLGPGLLGRLFDGIQRPLEMLYSQHGALMTVGSPFDPLDPAKLWRFIPNPDLAQALSQGKAVQAAAGLVLGTVQETESNVCAIMVPPRVKGGNIASLIPQGEVTADATIAFTDLGEAIPLSQWWPVRVPRPFAIREPMDQPLLTGQRVLDCLFPLAKGGAAAIVGSFGTGKTIAQHSLAQHCDADIIIYISCGARGNEVARVFSDFTQRTDPWTGYSLMERTILIAAGSNMPVAVREAAIYTGTALAEFYRDMGYHVLLMADSTSRWAEALQELSRWIGMEEHPTPAHLPTALGAFYERSGRVRTLSNREGSISIIGAVSPLGVDGADPVTLHTQRFTQCFWVLDQDLANARHFPALSWRESYSEYAEALKPWWMRADPRWAPLREEVLKLLKAEQQVTQRLAHSGPQALTDEQQLVLLVSEIIKEGFLQQNFFDPLDSHCIPAKQIRILELIMDFYKRLGRCISLGATVDALYALEVPSAIKEVTVTLRERILRLKNDRNEGADQGSPGYLDFEQVMHDALDELERSCQLSGETAKDSV